MKTKYIALLLLLLTCGIGRAQNKPKSDSAIWFSTDPIIISSTNILTSPTGKTFEIGNAGGELIVQCSSSADGKAKNCQIAAGHTLDEAVNSLLDAQKIEGDSQQAEIDRAWKYGNTMYHIALRGNKALQSCVDSMVIIKKSLKGISGKAKP